MQKFIFSHELSTQKLALKVVVKYFMCLSEKRPKKINNQRTKKKTDACN